MTKSALFLGSLLTLAFAFPAFAEEKSTSELKQEIEAPVHHLTVTYDMASAGSLDYIQSPNQLACVRKQLNAYQDATSSFKGGTKAFTDTFSKQSIGTNIVLLDDTRSGDSDNPSVELDLTSLGEEDTYQHTMAIYAILSIDPKKHLVTCSVSCAADISAEVLKKNLGLKAKSESRPSKKSQGSSSSAI